MKSKHLRAATLGLILTLTGCGGLDPADEAFEREASGEGKADETGSASLSAFAGRFDQLDPDGNVLEGSSLLVSIQSQSVNAYAVVDGNSRSVMKGVVGGEPKIEKYTVSSQGFFGPATLERRKVVTTLRKVGRTLERTVEMYSWEVSLKVWEDWTLYGVISDKLILVDDEHVAWEHFESQYDSEPSRRLYLRN